jgi:hypothetical protein
MQEFVRELQQVVGGGKREVAPATRTALARPPAKKPAPGLVASRPVPALPPAKSAAAEKDFPLEGSFEEF